MFVYLCIINNLSKRIKYVCVFVFFFPIFFSICTAFSSTFPLTKKLKLELVEGERKVPWCGYICTKIKANFKNNTKEIDKKKSEKPPMNKWTFTINFSFSLSVLRYHFEAIVHFPSHCNSNYLPNAVVKMV